MDHMSPRDAQAADLQFGAGLQHITASIPRAAGSLTVSGATWFTSAQSWERKVCLLRSTILAVLLGTTVVGPAAAEDCFPKIRAAEARMAAPHRPAPARKPTAARRPVNSVKPVVRVAHVKPIRVPARPASTTQKLVESSYAMQTRPIPWVRPAGCDKNPTLAIQSAPPIVEKPPAQLLLDEIAGPNPTPPTPPEEAGPTFGGGVPPGVPFGGGGQPPGLPPGGGQPPGQPPGGGQPPVTPPENPPGPPVTPPPPPEVPPVFPPPEGPPPVVPPGGPPTVPPEGPPPQPPILPPEGPTPPTTPPLTPVPEPSTWVMLISGFFFVGQGVRSRRAARARLA